MSETVLQIEGMKCMHCKMTVEKTLKAVPGVLDVRVDLERKQATVSGQADAATLAKVVQGAGFTVTS